MCHQNERSHLHVEGIYTIYENRNYFRHLLLLVYSRYLFIFALYQYVWEYWQRSYSLKHQQKCRSIPFENMGVFFIEVSKWGHNKSSTIGCDNHWTPTSRKIPKWFIRVCFVAKFMKAGVIHMDENERKREKEIFGIKFSVKIWDVYGTEGSKRIVHKEEDNKRPFGKNLLPINVKNGACFTQKLYFTSFESGNL